MTAAEEAAYRTLLREGPSTLADLAARHGASVAALRRLLPRLEDLGLVTRLAGRPLRLLATPPHVAVEALVASRQEEIARSRAAIGPLLAEAAPHPEELVEVVSGRTAVSRRYLQLMNGAREELLVLVQPPFATDATVSSDEQERTMRRGIAVRGIYGPRRSTSRTPSTTSAAPSRPASRPASAPSPSSSPSPTAAPRCCRSPRSTPARSTAP